VLIAGLTGGIASGKSTVSGIFQKAGAIIIDADVMARKAVTPGLPAWQAVKTVFGDQVIRPDGTLDRSLIGELVFKDQQLRRRLEEIIHPRVRDLMDREVSHLMKTSPKTVVIKDIPLLFETGMTDGLAEIIVVYVPAETQIKRLMERDRIGWDAARARIDAQLSIEEKRRLGTLVIDNSGDLSHTESQVLDIYQKLAAEARKDE
jgi:dephospho-CoA kinase